MEKKPKTCWKTEDPLRIKYHDEEWGVPLHDDNRFFEFLALGGFQAGLTWWLVLKKRKSLREAFDNFDPRKVANYDTHDIERLMRNQGLIRNKAKIMAAINNAKQFPEIQKEFGSFDTFIWQFVHGETIRNTFEKISDLPAETEDSKAMSKELKRRGFKFVGPTICYAFMQATGLVNDHIASCFRNNEIYFTSARYESIQTQLLLDMSQRRCFQKTGEHEFDTQNRRR